MPKGVTVKQGPPALAQLHPIPPALAKRTAQVEPEYFSDRDSSKIDSWLAE